MPESDDPPPPIGGGDLAGNDSGEAGPEVLTRTFPATPDAVPLARTWACLMMMKFGCLEDSGTAALLLGELTTNAVRHAMTRRFTIRLDFREGFEAAVHDDDDARLPWQDEKAPEGMTSHGLGVVAALADAWGVQEVPGGKWVWFRLAMWAPATPGHPGRSDSAPRYPRRKGFLAQ